MKRTGLLTLVLSMITSTAFATEANRADVARARADGENLSRVERLTLKSKVILAESVRSQFVLAQIPMNALGLNHQRGPVTFTLGVGQATAEAMLGAFAAKKLSAARFGKLDRAIGAKYAERTQQREWLKTARAEADALRGEEIKAIAAARTKALSYQTSPEVADKLKNLEENITARETLLADVGTDVARLSRDAKWFERLGRPTRLVLGAVVLPVVMVEGAISFLAVSVPDEGDQVIQKLTDFIDDARATLEGR